MNARQENAWKNLSFYRGYLPPADRERVKEYLLLALTEDRRDGSAEPSSRQTSQSGINDGLSGMTGLITSPLGVPFFHMDDGSSNGATPLSPMMSGSAPSQPLSSNVIARPPKASATLPSGATASSGGGGSGIGSEPARRFFMIKKSAVTQVPHFKSFLLKVKKCLDICTNPLPCVPDCPNVHVAVVGNPDLVELTFDPLDSLIVNRGSQLPSLSVRLGDMEKTAGALFCCGLVKHHVTQAMQGTQCRFGDKCRYGNRCLFIHMKETAVADTDSLTSFSDITESETKIEDAVPFLQTQPAFIERLKEMGIETVGDVQLLSTTAFDALVARSPEDEQWLWTQVHLIRELKERGTPLPFALATFPGLTFERVAAALEAYRLESLSQLLEMKPKSFYALRLPPKILDACERIRQRYEPERDVYSTLDLSRLAEGSFFRKIVSDVLAFRLTKAHKSWRKQDATRPIVTSLITYVEYAECHCHSYGALSATTTPMLGSALVRQQSTSTSPVKTTSSSGIERENSGVMTTVTATAAHAFCPENSWCRCPRKYEIAVNYELSTPSGSRCSEQNCLGKLASMGLPTCAVREILVHGDLHNNEDPNPLFPCGVCENMLRRITHDVQKMYGGDVTLYMFDQVSHPKKLVCLPVQEISHREGSHFKRFIQEDLRGDDMELLKLNGSMGNA